jgi:hypothetical protein
MSSEYEPPEVEEIGALEKLTGGSVTGEADGNTFEVPETEISG